MGGVQNTLVQWSVDALFCAVRLSTAVPRLRGGAGRSNGWGCFQSRNRSPGRRPAMRVAGRVACITVATRRTIERIDVLSERLGNAYGVLVWG